MSHRYPVLQNPSEALEQQLKCSQEHDKGGQHGANCLFVNRISEPWANQYMKYILMECYIYRIDQHLSLSPWNCPLPGCNAPYLTFPEVIHHLDKCSHLKPNIRQYTCPACHKIAQVPAASVGPGQKTMLKFTKSMESFRGHFSPRCQFPSPGSSPTAASCSSDNSISQANELVSPTSYVIGKSTSNDKELKLDTKFPPSMYAELCCEKSGLTSTTTTSSDGIVSELWSSSSAHELPSASSLSQTMISPSQTSWFGMSPPDGPSVFSCARATSTSCDAQQFGGVHYQSTPYDFQGHAMSQQDQPFSEEGHPFSEDITGMPMYGTNMEGIMYDLLSGRDDHVNCPDFLQQLHVQFGDPLQEWPQQPLLADMSVDLTQELTMGSGVVAAASAACDLRSLTETSMTESGAASEGSTSPASIAADQAPGSPSSLRCSECKWSPDMKTGKRSLKTLKHAVDKHFKRNHQSRDHQCPACPQSFHNRPDNVKPHVKRKHPEVYERIYGQKKKTAAHSQAQDGSESPSESRAGCIVKTPGAKPAAGKRSGRYTRSQRACGRPDDL